MIVGGTSILGMVVGLAVGVPYFTDVEAYRRDISMEPKKVAGGGGSRGSMWSNMDTEKKKKL